MNHRDTDTVRKVLLGIGMLTLVVGARPASALADDCVALGGAIVGAECQVSADVTRSGPFAIAETLHILPTGRIVAGAAGIALSVNGDFVMDVPTTTNGSKISGDVSGTNATAGTVKIDVTGDMLLRGNGSKGAKISAEQTSGSCAGGFGGVVDIDVAGDVEIQHGATVSVDARCSAGSIEIDAGGVAEVSGLVTAVGMLSGVGGSLAPGGGQITIRAACDLLITDTGVVISRGQDPGADLVHLEGGCNVTVYGYVASTGNGHGVPNNPPNHCNGAFRPGKRANSTTCVEVWAGGDVLIDSTAPHVGEIDADGFGNSASGNSWVDVFARGDIQIVGDSAGVYAIHANRTATNAEGGQIEIKSIAGGVSASGRAVQANATLSGGDGGEVTIQAGAPTAPAGNVALGSSSVEARGSGTGTLPAGGDIQVRSFNAQVNGVAPGELDAFGAGGSVRLQGCATVPPAVSYTGTSTPAATIVPAACGGAPVVAAYVVLPVCQQSCTGGNNNPPGDLRGRKMESTPNGTVPLGGWTVFLDLDGDGALDVGEPTKVTAADGTYSFTNLPPGPIQVCEVMQAGWLPQTPVCRLVNVQSGTVVDVPDFVNQRNQQVFFTCPEDANANVTIAVSTTLVGPTVYPTLQAAVNAATANDVIGMFTNTIENVVIAPPFPMIITQCTLARITAADSSLPVITINGNQPVSITGLDTVGGTIGFLVTGNGHSLRAVRASGASQSGVDLEGDSNFVTLNRVESNLGSGVTVAGDRNEVRGGTISGNGTGITVTATGQLNVLNGSIYRDNTGNGVVIAGSQNVGKSLKSNFNGANGYVLSGNSNTLQSSQGEGNGANGVLVTGTGNTVKGNKLKTSTLCEFSVTGAGTTDGGGNNTKNGVVFTNIEAGGCFE